MKCEKWKKWRDCKKYRNLTLKQEEQLKQVGNRIPKWLVEPSKHLGSVSIHQRPLESTVKYPSKTKNCTKFGGAKQAKKQMSRWLYTSKSITQLMNKLLRLLSLNFDAQKCKSAEKLKLKMEKTRKKGCRRKSGVWSRSRSILNAKRSKNEAYPGFEPGTSRLEVLRAIQLRQQAKLVKLSSRNPWHLIMRKNIIYDTGRTGILKGARDFSTRRGVSNRVAMRIH